MSDNSHLEPETIEPEEKPAGTLEFDPQTHSFVGSVSAEPGAETMLRGSGAALTRVRSRRQTQSAFTYQAIVVVDGWKINVDLMDEEEYETYHAEEKQVVELMAELATAGENAADHLYERQTSVVNRVMSEKVKGFEGFAATDDEKIDLFFPDKQRISDLIVQKSRLGRADTDFLPRS